jgi:hypothetical protein
MEGDRTVGSTLFASLCSVVERVLRRAQFALVDNVLDGVVVLASYPVTNAVARLRNHRHNHKEPLVHAPDPIHDGLADVEMA